MSGMNISSGTDWAGFINSSLGVTSNNSSNNIVSASLSGSNQTSGLFAGSSGLLSDYAAIKNGSYGKLLKAYYSSEASQSTSSSSGNKTTVKDQATADSSKALAESATALFSTDISSQSSEQILKKVKSFVEDYNSTITKSADSTDSNVLRGSVNMIKTTDTYESVLSKAGITINADNTLSLDENQFKNANKSTLKALFSGASSFADQIAGKASSIYYQATGKAITSYTSNGNYSGLNMNSMLDTMT